MTYRRIRPEASGDAGNRPGRCSAGTTSAQGLKEPNTSFIWEGAAGKPSRRVKPFNEETRRLIDRESADRGVAFMEKHARARTPFFLYYPITQIHFPTLPHPDFARTDPGRPGVERNRS